MPKLRNITALPSHITSAVKMPLVGLIVMLCSSFHSRHPYYIGLTDINITKNPQIQVSVRLFSNDLEDALRKSSGQAVDILHPRDKASADSLLYHYINKRLQLQINGKAMHLHYVGCEKEEESVWTYLEIRQAKATAIRHIVVNNTLLYEAFPAQTHIIRLSRYDATSSHKLTNPDAKAEFHF